MHTATQLSPEMFSLTVGGENASAEDLFPDWHIYDRVGVVIHEPLGGLGASLLMQAATALYFSHLRSVGQEFNYPELYTFNVGRRFGDLSVFDVWPGSREVLVDSDPLAVLQAINDRGITRLVVPETPPTQVDYPFPERTGAHTRIKSSFAYSAAGQTENADVTIAATDPATEENPRHTLDILSYVNQYRSSDDADTCRWLRHVDARLSEVSDEDRRAASAARAALLDDGFATETYRRLSIDDALRRLVPAD
jgi:hypothetical protein